MMPQLIDEPYAEAPMPTLDDISDMDFASNADVHYTLSAADNEKVGANAEPEKEVVVEIVANEEDEAFYSPATPSEDRVLAQPEMKEPEPENDYSAGVGVRSYLAKPSNIYAESKKKR